MKISLERLKGIIMEEVARATTQGGGSSYGDLEEYLPPGRMTPSTSGDDLQKMAAEIRESGLPAETMVDVMAALSEIGHTEGTFTYEYLFRQPSADTARRNAKKILDILSVEVQESEPIEETIELVDDE